MAKSRFILLKDFNDGVECRYTSIEENEFETVEEAADYFNQEYGDNDGSYVITKVVAITHSELVKISGEE